MSCLRNAPRERECHVTPPCDAAATCFPGNAAADAFSYCRHRAQRTGWTAGLGCIGHFFLRVARLQMHCCPLLFILMVVHAWDRRSGRQPATHRLSEPCATLLLLLRFCVVRMAVLAVLCGVLTDLSGCMLAACCKALLAWLLLFWRCLSYDVGGITGGCRRRRWVLWARVRRPRQHVVVKRGGIYVADMLGPPPGCAGGCSRSHLVFGVRGRLMEMQARL